MGAIAKTFQLLRTEGVWPTVKRIARALHWKYQVYRDHLSFDRKYGTETSQGESAYLEAVPSAWASSAVPYEATIWREFEDMMALLPIDPREFTFVDLGCGKGRVLLFAALLGFPRIVGVEFAEGLVEIARRNITRFRERSATAATIDVRCQDIANFNLPDEDIVLYLYNPSGAGLIKIVIEQVKSFVARGRHRLWIVYRNPKCGEMFEALPFLETIASNPVHAVYRRKAPT